MRFEVVDLDGVRQHRGWFVGLGVGFLLLGGLACVLPFVASLVTAVVLGWLMMASGVLQAVHAFQNRRWGGYGWALVGGLLRVLAGVLVALFPVVGTLVLTLVLAAFFVASGIVKGIHALQHRAFAAWGFLLFDGLVSLALGFLLLAGWPGTGVWALGLLVGVELIFGGVSLLLLGAGARTSARVGP